MTMGSSAVPLALMEKSPGYMPLASVSTSPALAAPSAAESEAASVTLTGWGCAGSAFGTGRVRAASGRVWSTLPSGSVACSSRS